MNNTAIRVENLSKIYRIGAKKQQPQTRAGLFKRAVISPIAYLRSTLRPPREEEIFWALRTVSFEVKHGEVLGIIGSNGAGKSTLLKILSRITEPTSGRAVINGRVGALLEVGTGFHPELTGRENIYLNGTILGMKRKEVERKFDEIVAFSDVEKFIDTPVKHYSSGMYVRLAFAVAAHMEPEILIVDEVLAVGDAAFQKKCLSKMGDVAKEGRTVLFVSHNMTAIMRLCSYALWLQKGSLVECGDVQTVVSHYLSDDFIPWGERTFPDAATSRQVSIRRVAVMDSAMHTRHKIPHEEQFHVMVEYEVSSSVKKLRIGIKLYNEHNLAVLHSATSDSSSLPEAGGLPGLYRAYVKIPGSLLAPKKYYIDIGAWSPDFGHHHLLTNAVAFIITDESLDSIGDEVLRPMLTWKLDFINGD